MNRTQIAELMPHKGDMMLLDKLISWSEDQISCLGWTPGLELHPLREDVSGKPSLPAFNALEYAAQAIALHGILKGQVGETGPRSAFIAGLQELSWSQRDLLDKDWPLILKGEAIGGLGDTGAKYAVTVSNAAGDEILTGKALVMFSPDTSSG